MPKPARKKRVPHSPKKCMGRLANFPTNEIDTRSRKPLTNRLNPNFDWPYFLCWCVTTFSPIFLKPAHFASTGM